MELRITSLSVKNGYLNNIKQAFASFSRNNILYIHKESIDIDRQIDDRQIDKSINSVQFSSVAQDRSIDIFNSMVVVKLLNYFQLFVTPWAIQPARLCLWDFPGKNTGISYHFIPRGIFTTQGINPGFLHSSSFFTN